MRKFCFLGLSIIACYGHSEQKPFVIGHLLGQLGNQMFEVATASALAWENGAEVFFPDLGPQSEAYQHIFHRCNVQRPEGNVQYTYSIPVYGYQPIPYRDNMEIYGYCQNEKYFSGHRERLIELFAPKAKDLKYIQKKYGWILEHPKSVSVHLRYYYAEKPDEPSFIQYGREYFEKAMALFDDDCLFVVMSDNLEFAKKAIPTEGRHVYFVEKEPFYIDFYLQSLCKHNIICNSTFSWWSAWLNKNEDKVVVRPKEWLGGYPDIGGPEEWVKIEAKDAIRG